MPKNRLHTVFRWSGLYLCTMERLRQLHQMRWLMKWCQRVNINRSNS